MGEPPPLQQQCSTPPSNGPPPDDHQNQPQEEELQQDEDVSSSSPASFYSTSEPRLQEEETRMHASADAPAADDDPADRQQQHQHEINPPPYWSSTTTTTTTRHARSSSYHSLAHAGGPIQLEDHSEDQHEQSQGCWARSATVDDYTVVSGSSGIGAYVVWHCTVRTLKGGDMNIRKRYVCMECNIALSLFLSVIVGIFVSQYNQSMFSITSQYHVKHTLSNPPDLKPPSLSPPQSSLPSPINKPHNKKLTR